MVDCWIECTRDEIIQAAYSIVDSWVLDKCDSGTFQILSVVCKKGPLFNLRKFVDLLEDHALKQHLKELEESREKKCVFNWGKE
jgi:hypothetical protein